MPEFFTLLGIEIFVAIGMISALLDRQLPLRFPYVFQMSAALGLGELLLSLGLVNGQGTTYQTRFWVSIVYLGFALSSVVGTNVYLIVVRRGTTLAPIFSSTLTVPFLMVSALFISAFVGSREVTFSTAALGTLGFLIVIASLCTFGFMRELSKRFRPIGTGIGLPSIGPFSVPSQAAEGSPRPILPPAKQEDWEEFSPKEEAEN